MANTQERNAELGPAGLFTQEAAAAAAPLQTVAADNLESPANQALNHAEILELVTALGTIENELGIKREESLELSV